MSIKSPKATDVEDRNLERMAKERERTFDRRKALTLDGMRTRLGLKRQKERTR